MVNVTENDFLTPLQKTRKEMDEKVVQTFKTYAAEYIGNKGVSPNLFLSKIAEKLGITITGIKRILKRNGEFESCAQLRQRFNNNKTN